MGIGHHIAITCENETRAHTARLLLRPAPARGTTARNVRNRHPKTAEKLQHLLIAAFKRWATLRHLFCGTDIHHRRPDRLHQRGEIRQTLHQRRRRRLRSSHQRATQAPQKQRRRQCQRTKRRFFSHALVSIMNKRKNLWRLTACRGSLGFCQEALSASALGRIE